MAQAKKGDRVRIDFTGTIEDGTVIDTTAGEEHTECGSDDCGCEKGPMEVAIGEEQFFLQIEEALVGMAVGDKKTVTIPAEDAFGEYDADRVFTVERKQFPKDINPEVGQELELIAEDDESIGVTVVEANDESVTLDANHPLAGEELNYEFELVEIL